MTNWSFWRDIQQAIFLTWKRTCVTVFSPITSDGLIKIILFSYKSFLAYETRSNIIPEKLFSGIIWMSSIETPKDLSLQINLFRNKQKIAINSQGCYSRTCIIEGWSKQTSQQEHPKLVFMLFWFYWIASKPSEHLIRTNAPSLVQDLMKQLTLS